MRGTLISFRVTSDPNRADTDGDGLFDGEEFLRRLHPSRGDSDLDGLSDFKELRGFQLRDDGRIFTDPLDADTDHDKLRDGREAELVDVEANRWIVRVEGKEPYRVFSNPLTADADFDGVADGDERTAGTDPTKFNTDGDGRDDGVELRDGFNPLAEDFRVRVTLVGLTIDDDADSGVLSNTGPGEFRFAFIVQPPVGDLLLADGSDLTGGDADGNVSISSGTTFRLNVGISFTMTASQTFTVTGLLEEYDDLVLRESRGTKVTFGNLDDAPITLPDGTATGPGFFMGKDLLDDPFVQYYTVTFGVGDNVGMDDNTVLAHIKGSLRFAIMVQP